MALTRTVQNVIEVVAEHEQIDRDRAVDLFNEAHVEIIRNCHLIPDTTTTITLTSGTQEYALPDSCVRVWDAAYYSTSTNWVSLEQTNVDTLFNDYGPGWQLQSAGTPWSFFERGGNIGFMPAPNVTSTGGYPSVTLFYTNYTALSFYDKLPTTIMSMYPWVYFICSKQAVVTAPDKVPMYHNLYEQEMKRMQEGIYGRVARDRPRVGLKIPRIRRA
jgi:hypothetical protein